MSSVIRMIFRTFLRCCDIKAYRVFLITVTALLALTACDKDIPSSDEEIPDPSKYALVDLHLHLDGSLTPEDVLKMAELQGTLDELPTTDLTQLKAKLTCPANNQDLTEYLKCFDLPVSVMQSKPSIAYGVKSLIERLNAQGLIYAEIRFAPQLHQNRGLTQEDVVQAAIEGRNQALSECPGIKANLILCCMRGDAGKDASNLETIDLVKKYLDKGVVAADLAGDEASYPTSYYKATFEYATQQGVPFSIHAGEADGSKSINCALDFGAKRIGHGIRCWSDAATMARLKQMDVCLDLCPKSNLDTRALAVDGLTTIAQYPLPILLSNGVPVSINTDDMTVSDTQLKSEFQRLFEAKILTAEQAEKIVETSISYAFLSDSDKAELLALAKKRMK